MIHRVFSFLLLAPLAYAGAGSLKIRVEGTGRGHVYDAATGEQMASPGVPEDLGWDGPANLQAQPEEGSYFAGWSGDCAGVLPACFLPTRRDREHDSFSVVARFMAGKAPALGAWTGEARTDYALPPPGSPERKALLNPLRKELEAKAKQKIVFKVSRIGIRDEYAAVRAQPQNPAGRPVPLTKVGLTGKQRTQDSEIVAILVTKKDGWQLLAWTSASKADVAELVRTHLELPDTLSALLQ